MEQDTSEQTPRGGLTSLSSLLASFSPRRKPSPHRQAKAPVKADQPNSLSDFVHNYDDTSATSSSHSPEESSCSVTGVFPPDEAISDSPGLTRQFGSLFRYFLIPEQFCQKGACKLCHTHSIAGAHLGHAKCLSWFVGMWTIVFVWTLEEKTKSEKMQIDCLIGACYHGVFSVCVLFVHSQNSSD